MKIQTIIGTIIKKRQQKVPLLEKVEQELEDLSSQVKKIRRMATGVENESVDASQVMRNAAQELSISTNSVQNNITELIRKLHDLTERFGKATINIGISGASGQGKSTLLQNIANLSDNEVPTSSGLACTGARSRIYHYEGEAHGDINFYTEEEMFQEIIIPKYDRLKLSPIPISLEDFQKSPLAELPVSELDKPDQDTAHYENLKKIYKALPALQNCLATKKRISLDEVSNYVTQSNQNYIAVRTADIFVKFPNHDVTGLCLVDLPGLEAEQDHAAKIMLSLKREIDAMIFLKMPRSKRAIWEESDYTVIDLVASSIKEIALSDRLFIVFNETEDQSNSEQIKMLVETPLTRYSTPNMLIANCKNSQEVKDKIFNVLLTHLERNMDKIDQQYLQTIYVEVQLIVEDLEIILKPLSPLLSVPESDIETRESFRKPYKEFMEQLTTQLKNLVETVRGDDYSKSIQNDFLQKIKNVCDETDQNPPVASAEELKTLITRKHGWPAATQEHLNYLRTYLAKYLASGLDEYLETMVEDIYEKILIKILPESLFKLLPKEVLDQTPRHRLKKFYELLDPERQSKLREGFEYLLSFTFSYHSHFHHRVRQEMTLLDSMAYNFTQALIPNDIQDSSDIQIAEDIHRGLENQYQEVVYKVRRRFMDEMRDDPSNAIFSLVEEIRDRLSFEQGIDDEWDSFLFANKGLLWPDIFGKIDQHIRLQREWQKTLKDLIDKAESLKNLSLKHTSLKLGDSRI